MNMEKSLIECISRGMTYRELFNAGSNCLMEAGVPDPAYDAWSLLSYAAGMDRARYYMDQTRICEDESVTDVFRDMIKRRMQRIPLQHILGKAPFMEYDFYVNDHVLTPRADTEVLVEETLALMKMICYDKGRKDKGNLAREDQGKESPLRILDMCTGSGCIGISLCLMGQDRGIPLVMTGIDYSRDALKVAGRNNEELCGGEVKLLESDMFTQLSESCVFDIIVSNPPYIPSGELAGLMPEVRDHEPHMALDGMEDGLHFYRILASEGRKRIRPGGYLALEIGYDQGVTVPGLLEQEGFVDIRVIRDLAGLDRVVTGRVPDSL